MEENKEVVSHKEIDASIPVSTDIRELNELIQKESAFIDLLNMEIKKVIVGQHHMIERLIQEICC